MEDSLRDTEIWAVSVVIFLSLGGGCVEGGEHSHRTQAREAWGWGGMGAVF